ncbi:MAG: hypothetical protein CL608_17225 [Anaerolineaceae bacterium]|nr:hypothetical protein [Anaerolineaceae bacterium]
MSLLSKTPIDLNNPTLKKLLEELIKAYTEPYKAKDIVVAAGITIGNYPDGLIDVRQRWTRTLEILVDEGRLRTLVEKALADLTVAAYHPFFTEVLAEDDRDRPAGLTADERKTLSATYMSIIPKHLSFEALLVQGLGQDLEEFPGANLQQRIDTLIASYELDERITELFEAPFNISGQENNNVLQLARLALDPVRTSYEERMNQSWKEDPFEACFLNQGIPFIDRQDFRKQAKKLSKEGAKRLLIINGDPGVGKTHSKKFIEKIAPYCEFKFCFIDMKKETPSLFYPDTLATRLDSDITLPPHPDHPQIPLKEEVSQKWAEVIGEWLIKKMKLEQGQCWIALDGFAHEDLPAPTKRLVNDLVEAVWDRLPHVRLILLDYPLDDLDEEIRLFVEEEDIEVVTQPELEEYMIKAVKELRLQKDTVELREKAREIVEGLSAAPEKHMAEIKVGVINTAKSLSQD